MKTLGIFFVALMITSLSGVSVPLSGCHSDRFERTSSGKVVKQTRPVSDFTEIEAGGAFEIFIRQASSPAVIVEADAEIIDQIVTEVVGSKLKIYMKNRPTTWMRDIDDMKIYISVKDLKKLDLSGAVEVVTENRLSGTDLKIEASGASEVKLELAMQSLDLNLSGASELTLLGTAGTVRIDGSGASDIEAYDLAVTDLTVYGSGAIEASVTVSGSLKANVSGACTIRYKGNPKVDIHSSGASSIKRAD